MVRIRRKEPISAEFVSDSNDAHGDANDAHDAHTDDADPDPANIADRRDAHADPSPSVKEEYRSPSEESQEFLDALDTADDPRARRPQPVRVKQEEDELDEDAKVPGEGASRGAGNDGGGTHPPRAGPSHTHTHSHYDDSESESESESSGSEYRFPQPTRRRARRDRVGGANRPIVIDSDSDEEASPSNAAGAPQLSDLDPEAFVTSPPVIRGKARNFLVGLKRKEVDEVLTHPQRNQRRAARLYLHSRDPLVRKLPLELSCARCVELGSPCYIWINPLAVAHQLQRRPCLTCYHRKCSFAAERVRLHDPQQGWLPGDKDEPAEADKPKAPKPSKHVPFIPPRTRQLQPRVSAASGSATPNMSGNPSPNSAKKANGEQQKRGVVRPRPGSPVDEPPAKLMRTGNGAARPAASTSAAAPAQPPAEAREMTDEEKLRERARRQAAVQVTRQGQEEHKRRVQEEEEARRMLKQQEEAQRLQLQRDQQQVQQQLQQAQQQRQQLQQQRLQTQQTQQQQRPQPEVPRQLLWQPRPPMQQAQAQYQQAHPQNQGHPLAPYHVHPQQYQGLQVPYGGPPPPIHPHHHPHPQHHPTQPQQGRIAAPAAHPPGQPQPQAGRPTSSAGPRNGVPPPRPLAEQDRSDAASSDVPDAPDHPHISPSPGPAQSPLPLNAAPAQTPAAPVNTRRPPQPPSDTRPVRPQQQAVTTPATTRAKPGRPPPARQAHTPPTPASLDTKSLPRSPGSTAGSTVERPSTASTANKPKARTSLGNRPVNPPRPRNTYQVLGVPDPDGDNEWPNSSTNDAIYRVHQNLFDAFPGVKLEVASPFDRDDDPEYDILKPSDLARVPFLSRVTKIDEPLAAVLRDTPRDALPEPDEEGIRLLPSYLYSPRHPCVGCVNEDTPCTYAPIRSPPPQRPGFPPPLTTLIPLPDCLACRARSSRKGKPCPCVHLIQMASGDVHAKLHVLAWGTAPEPEPGADEEGDASFDERAVWFDPKAADYVKSE